MFLTLLAKEVIVTNYNVDHLWNMKYNHFLKRQ
jgi:hypothetical protein